MLSAAGDVLFAADACGRLSVAGGLLQLPAVLNPHPKLNHTTHTPNQQPNTNVAVADNLIEKEDLVSLDNGCVCCSLRKDVVKALAEIERRARHRNKRVDQVILETTGLADPAPVAFTFFANPWIASRFRLDSIVCVCDTRYALQHLDATGSSSGEAPGAINEAAQQIAFADIILLNKTDLVSAEQLERVKQVVRDINQSARLIECRLNAEGGRPPLSELLDSNAFSVHKALKVDPYFLDSDSGSDDAGDDSDSDEEATAEGGGERAASLPAAAAAATVAAAAKAAGAGASGAADDATATATAGGAPPAGKAADAAAGTGAAAADTADEFASTATHANAPDGATAASAAAAAAAQQPASLKRAAADACAAGPSGTTAAAAAGAAAERRPKRRRKHMHDVAGIGSVGIVARGPLDEYRFSMFMRDLLTEKAKDIFRCKGVLAVHVSVCWFWGSCLLLKFCLTVMPLPRGGGGQKA